jgi:hypothetical protein
MNDAPEDFEKLRKLLKLKQYEQPPPGYFNNFSQQVIAQLETAGRSNRAGLLSSEAPWARRLVRMLETNPIFAGAFGVAICALLIYGVLSFQYVDRASVAMMGDTGSASSPRLLSKATAATFTSSIDPRLSTNISSVLSLSVQPNNNAEPVMFTPGQ